MSRHPSSTEPEPQQTLSPELAYAPPATENLETLDTPEDLPRQEPSKRRIATQFISTVGMAFGIVGLQMGQGILLARILGPVGRGEWATAVFFSQLLLYIGLLGGLEVICRHAAKAELNSTKLRRAALKLGLTTGAITTAIACIFCVLALPAGKQFLIPVAILCSLAIAGQQVMLIMTAVDRGRGDWNAYNVRRVIAAAAFPALLLIVHLVFGVTLQIACWLFVLASILSVLACVWGVGNPLRGPSYPAVAPLLKESRPYALSMFATDLFERLDLLLILWFAGLQDQGFYAAMVPVAYPLTVLPNTMGLFLFNAGADQKKRLTVKDVHRILASSLAAQTVCTIVFMLLISTAVNLLYGPAFAPAVQFALWLAPVAAIKGILQGLDSYVKGRGKPLAPIVCRIVAAVLMIVLTWILLPIHGAVAIAMAALAGQVLCLIWLSAIIYADVQSHENTDATSMVEANNQASH